MKIKPISGQNNSRKTPTEMEIRAFTDKREYSYVNLFFLGTITFLIVISLSGINNLANDYLFAALISQAEYLIPFLIYLFLANKKLGVLNRTGIKKISLAKIVISMCAGISIIPFLNLINGFSLLLVNDITTNRVTEAAAKYDMWIMVLAIGVIPPIVEEMIYRGAFFTAYRRAGVLKGALLSAFIFGIMHGNLNQFAYAFVAGFLFSMLVYAGGSIICTMIIHIIINSISIISLYYSDLFPRFIVDTKTEVVNLNYVLSLVIPGLISLMLVMVAFYLLRKLSKAEEDTKHSSAGIVDAALIVGIIIMTINIFAAEILSRQL